MDVKPLQIGFLYGNGCAGEAHRVGRVRPPLRHGARAHAAAPVCGGVPGSAVRVQLGRRAGLQRRHLRVTALPLMTSPIWAVDQAVWTSAGQDSFCSLQGCPWCPLQPCYMQCRMCMPLVTLAAATGALTCQHHTGGASGRPSVCDRAGLPRRFQACEGRAPRRRWRLRRCWRAWAAGGRARAWARGPPARPAFPPSSAAGRTSCTWPCNRPTRRTHQPRTGTSLPGCNLKTLCPLCRPLSITKLQRADAPCRDSRAPSREAPCTSRTMGIGCASQSIALSTRQHHEPCQFACDTASKLQSVHRRLMAHL